MDFLDASEAGIMRWVQFGLSEKGFISISQTFLSDDLANAEQDERCGLLSGRVSRYFFN